MKDSGLMDKNKEKVITLEKTSQAMMEIGLKISRKDMESNSGKMD